MDVEYISKDGFKKLRDELTELRTKERLRIAERLLYAKSLGDLSENAEFDAAKEDQMLNEMRIRELEDLLSRAKIIDSPRDPSRVSIGSRIVVEGAGARGEREAYTIVGAEEADPARGTISHESPLGRAFLNHKEGDRVAVVTPRGNTEYVIVEVHVS